MKKLFATFAVLLVLLLTASIVTAVAAPLHVMHLAISPEDLSAVILGIVGVLLQLAVMYVPRFDTWYQGLPNKGLAMLAMVIVVGGIYYGLACTPLAVMLNIALACTVPDLFTLLRAIFIIAMTQVATYNYSRNVVNRKFGGIR